MSMSISHASEVAVLKAHTARVQTENDALRFALDETLRNLKRIRRGEPAMDFLAAWRMTVDSALERPVEPRLPAVDSDELCEILHASQQFASMAGQMEGADAERPARLFDACAWWLLMLAAIVDPDINHETSGTLAERPRFDASADFSDDEIASWRYGPASHARRQDGNALFDERIADAAYVEGAREAMRRTFRVSVSVSTAFDARRG